NQQESQGVYAHPECASGERHHILSSHCCPPFVRGTKPKPGALWGRPLPRPLGVCRALGRLRTILVKAKNRCRVKANKMPDEVELNLGAWAFCKPLYGNMVEF